MPRTNREYLLRYADQAINDMERSLERLKMLSDAYGGVYLPLPGELPPDLVDEPEAYEGAHGAYQKYVDLVAAQVMGAHSDLVKFRKQFM